MKILSTNYHANITARNQISSRPVYQNSTDTFVKSTPSFKGAEQKVNGKVLLELSAFLTAGFVAFKKLTGGNDDLKDVELGIENNPFSDFFNKIVGEKDEKLKELEEENGKLKQENDDLKTKLEEKNEVKTEEAIPEETVSETEETTDSENITADEQDSEEAETGEQALPDTEEEESEFVKFPPKWGRLSAEQKILKDAVTRIRISPEYSKNLTAICREMLNKGTKDPENRKEMLNLAEELNACGFDTENLKSVIDKYNSGKNTNNPDSLNPDSTAPEEGKKPDGNNQNGEQASELYDPVAARKLKGTKQVGTLDLSTVPDRQGKRPRIQRGQITGTISAISADGSSNSTPAAAQVTAPSETKAALAISSEETKVPGVYKYKYNRIGTAPADMKKNLTDALKFFEGEYITEKNHEAKVKGEKREHIKWMYRKPVMNARKDDVIKEIDNCKNSGESSKYHYINKRNAEFVAEAINDEKRFEEMFTFHGATRFIERMVDFNNYSTSMEKQVAHALDVLQATIQRAVKQGLIMEDHDVIYTYYDEEGNERTEIQKGANIIIPKECYDEEAQKLFGVHPLKLGICRHRYENQALICTVFAKGIY